MRRAASLFVGAVVSALALPAKAQSSDHVRVHLVSDDDVFLQMIENRKWVDVCSSPCDRIVDADGRYRIEGPGVRPTSPFTLHATSLEGSESVEVDPSHDWARDTGFVLVGVGAAGLLAGFYLTWFGMVTERCDGSSTYAECTSANRDLVGVGVVTLLSGAIVGGLGAIVAITSSHSSVNQSASTSPRPKVRFLASEAPFRRESAAGGVRADSTALIAPIVSVSF